MFLFNYYMLFFFLIFLSSLFVIMSSNPVHSVYLLIICFLFTSILFVLVNAEFISMLIVIVYVGAISILFLFVIMMLNLRIVELYSTFYFYVPVSGIFALFLLFQLVRFWNNSFCIFNTNLVFIDMFPNWLYSVYFISNIFILGWILYNFYGFFVLLSSCLLLVSMMGSIVLTVDSSTGNMMSQLFMVVLLGMLKMFRYDLIVDINLCLMVIIYIFL